MDYLKLSSDQLISIILLIFILLVLSYIFPWNIWYRAKKASIKIKLIDLAFMKMRKSNVEKIIDSLILLSQHKLNIQKEELEAIDLAGGDILKIVKGILYAKNKNLILPFQVASSLELSKKNIIDTINNYLKNNEFSTENELKTEDLL